MGSRNCREAREIISGHLAGTNVKDRDKMIDDVQQLNTLEQIHRYVANSLLKYEGLGTSLKKDM